MRAVVFLSALSALSVLALPLAGGRDGTAGATDSRESASSAAVESLVVNIFQRFNLNGDTVLSWKEARELAESQMFEELGGPTAAYNFFARADADKSRTLSKREVTNFYLKWRRRRNGRTGAAEEDRSVEAGEKASTTDTARLNRGTQTKGSL